MMNKFSLAFLAVYFLSITVQRAIGSVDYAKQETYAWRKDHGLTESREQTIERFSHYMLTAGDVKTETQYGFVYANKATAWDMEAIFGKHPDLDDGSSKYAKDDLGKFTNGFPGDERYSNFPSRNYAYPNCKITPTGPQLKHNQQIVADLSQISDLLAGIPDMYTRKIGDVEVTLSTMLEADFEKDDNLWEEVFQIFKANLKVLYEKFWVYKEEKEKEEYASKDSQFLFARIDNKLVAFSQIQITLENQIPIGYIYEVQVVKGNQQHMIGMYMIYAWARIANYHGLWKLEGICLRGNTEALKFYHDLEIDLDAVMSPPHPKYFPVENNDNFMKNPSATITLAGFPTIEKLEYFEKRLKIDEDESSCCVEKPEYGKCCCISQLKNNRNCMGVGGYQK